MSSVPEQRPITEYAACEVCFGYCLLWRGICQACYDEGHRPSPEQDQPYTSQIDESINREAAQRHLAGPPKNTLLAAADSVLEAIWCDWPTVPVKVAKAGK